MTLFSTRHWRFQATLWATLLPLAGFAQGTVPTGSGTAGDPYIIDSADDLVFLSDIPWDVDEEPYLKPESGQPAYYKQVAEIDMNGIDFAGIDGITTGAAIRIHYDGQGHAISNLSISNSGDWSNYLGFIHEAENSTLMNLTFINPDVSNTNTNGTAYAGIAFGEAGGDMTIEHVAFINPTVSATSSPSTATCGSLIGIIQSLAGNPADVQIQNCITYGGTLTSSSSTGSVATGGFVGTYSNNSLATFSKCEIIDATFNTSCPTGQEASIGGFFGVMSYGTDGTSMTFNDCRNEGMRFDHGASNAPKIGGIVGDGTTGGSGTTLTIANCIVNDMVNTMESGAVTTYEGAFVGYKEYNSACSISNSVTTSSTEGGNLNASNLTTTNNLLNASLSDLTTLSTFTSRSFDLTTTWTESPFGNAPILNFDEVTEGNPAAVAAGEVLDLMVLALNDDLTLEANASGYAQLKADYIAGNGEVTEQQYTATEGWTMVASPFATSVSSAGDFVASTGTSWNASSWNTTTYGWDDATAQTFVPGKGYLVYLGESGIFTNVDGPWTLELTGAVNTSVTPSLAFTAYDAETSAWSTFQSTSGSAANGWNLVGNPFPCALDLSTVSFSNVNAAAYVFSDGSYVPLTAGPDYYIAPMQSFFVQATDAGTPSMGTLTMSANCNTAQAPAFRDVIDQIVLLASGDGATSDDLVYPMRDDATLDFEGAYDAWHLGNGNGKVNLFSLENGEAYAVNATAPAYGMHQQWTVAFRHDAGGTFELALDDSYLLEERTLEVEDPVTGALHNLFDGPMSFEYSTPGENLTFVLHVDRVGASLDAEGFSAAEGAAGGANSVDALEATEETLQVVVTSDGIQIVLNADGNWAGSLFDTQGRNVMDIRLNGRGQWQEGLVSIPAGIYLLHLQNTDGNQPALQTRFIKQ